MLDLPADLGRYRLLERISIGGMAEIFRAKATGEVGFEKEVAVKRILPHMASDREFVDMFIDEARTVAQLNHSNICQIFEFGQEQGAYFIALELVEGKDLRDMMVYHRRLGAPMPVNIVLHIMSKACEALEYAHTSRDAGGEPMHIVHRDVSPQNILVSYLGMVKLIDFGIAKAMGRLTKTQAGSIKGKFSYMSPEQVQAHPIDHRSDVFAAGTVLWECLTNHRLFKGENEIVTMQMVRKAEVRPPSELNNQIPATLDPIVLRALARDPEDRYQSAGEFLDDLENFMIRADMTSASSELSGWLRSTFSKDYKKLLEKRENPDDGVMLLRKPRDTAKLGSGGLTEEPRPPQVILGNRKKTDDVAMMATMASPDGEFQGDKTSLGMGLVPQPGAERTPSGTGPGRPMEVITPGSPPARRSEPSGLNALPTVETPVDNRVDRSQPEHLPPMRLEESGLKALPTVEETAPPSMNQPAGAVAEPSHSGVSQPAAVPVEPSHSGVSQPAVVPAEPSGSGLTALPTVEDPAIFDDDYDEYSQRYKRGRSRAPLIIGVVVVLLALVGGILLLVNQKKDPATPTGKDKPGAVAKAPPSKAAPRADTPAPAAQPAVQAPAGTTAADPVAPDKETPDKVQDPGSAPAGATKVAAPSPSPGAKPATGAKPAAESKPGTKRPVAAGGGKEEDLPDFNYIPPGSRAVHYEKTAEVLEPQTVDDGRKKPGDKPAADKPVAPPADKPVAPPADKPVADPPADKPVADPPADKPVADPPADPPADKPATIKPAAVAAPPAAAPQTGRLIVSTIPWAYVWINGKETGRSTPVSESRPIKLKPGKHKVTFFKDGQKFNYSVTITAGKTTSLVKKLEIK